MRFLFLHLQKLPMKSVGHRPLLVKWGGVRIENVQKVFIGEDCYFDTLSPELISIEEDVLRFVVKIINKAVTFLNCICKCGL